MSALTFLTICSLIAIFALVIVSLSDQYEKRQQRTRSKIRELKHRLELLEEIVQEISVLTESKVAAKLINEEIIDHVKQMMAIDDSAHYLSATLANAEKRNMVLADESHHYPLDRLKESDAKIAKAQYLLSEASKVLRMQQHKGKISLEELNLFVHQLAWAHLTVDVISHIGQAHKANNRGDILTAHAFYKRAQNSLIQSAHADPRRHKMIKELSEILNNQRQSLSQSLMPETQYNPDISDTTNFRAEENID